MFILFVAPLHGMIDALMRASAKENLSELLRVSRRLCLVLVIGHFILKHKL